MSRRRLMLRNAPSALEDNDLWTAVERGEGHNSAEEWRARYPFWQDVVRDALLQAAADLGGFFTIKRMMEELGRVENARGRVLADATIETRLRPAADDLVARGYLERTDYIAERINLPRGSVVYRISDIGREAALAARVLSHTGEDALEDSIAREIAAMESEVPDGVGDDAFDFGSNVPESVAEMVDSGEKLDAYIALTSSAATAMDAREKFGERSDEYQAARAVATIARKQFAVAYEDKPTPAPRRSTRGSTSKPSAPGSRSKRATATKRCGVPGRPRMVEPHGSVRKCRLCKIKHRVGAHRSHVVAGKETCQ